MCKKDCPNPLGLRQSFGIKILKGGRALTTHQQEKMIRFLRDKYSQGDYLDHEIMTDIYKRDNISAIKEV